MRARTLRRVVGAGVLALALSSCGSTTTTTNTAATTSDTAPRLGRATAGDLTLTKGWVTEVDVARPSSPTSSSAPSSAPSSGASGSMSMAATSAAYFTIRNAGGAADQLVSARSSAARQVELHGTTTSADQSSATMTDLRDIAVPAGGSAVLRPGGYHLMLVDPARSLVAGDHVRLTLTFRSGTVMSVSLPVLDREDRPES